MTSKPRIVIGNLKFQTLFPHTSDLLNQRFLSHYFKTGYLNDQMPRLLEQQSFPTNDAELKRVFSTRPVFEVPTLEVVTSTILDIGGHRYEEIKSL